MSQTVITTQTPFGPYGGAPGAGALALTMTAADASNGNSVALTGHEVLIAENTDSGAHTITITSVPDEEGRSGDVTSYSIPAGAVIAFSFLGRTTGWKQTDGTVHFIANDATVKFAVLTVAR